MEQKSSDIPTVFEIPDHWLVPKIKEGVLSDKKITLFYGWRDGGKSTSCIKILIFKCLFDERFRCAHVRQHYNELSGTTFRSICDEIETMGLSDKFLITKDNFQIVNKLRPNNYFFGASGDKPDKIRSTPNVTHVFWDEFHDANEDTFGSILGTLREKGNVQTKFIALFNNDKIRAKSFIDTTFFNPKTRIKEDIETILIKHTNNPFIDQEQTRKKLMIVCLGSKAKYDSLTAGEFIKEDPKNPFIQHLREDHIQPNPLRKDWNMFCIMDFNNDPFCAIVGNFRERNNGIDIEISEEIEIVEGSSIQLIEEIQLRYGNALHRIFISGDYSGKAGNAAFRGNLNHFKLIKNQLQLAKSQIRISPNPKHKDSREHCNYCLYHSSFFNITIDPSCKKLLQDLKYVEYDEEKQKIIKADRSKDNQQADFLDNFRYLIQNFVVKRGLLTLHSKLNS